MISLPIASTDETLVALLAYAKFGGTRVCDQKVNIKTSCYECKNARQVLGDSHLLCSKPCHTNTFNSHGVRSGWATYPLNFDPVWRTSECSNYEP